MVDNNEIIVIYYEMLSRGTGYKTKEDAMGDINNIIGISEAEIFNEIKTHEKFKHIKKLDSSDIIFAENFYEILELFNMQIEFLNMFIPHNSNNI